MTLNPSETVDVNRSQVVALAGLDPIQIQSGTSVRGKSRISKQGLPQQGVAWIAADQELRATPKRLVRESPSTQERRSLQSSTETDTSSLGTRKLLGKPSSRWHIRYSISYLGEAS